MPTHLLFWQEHLVFHCFQQDAVVVLVEDLHPDRLDPQCFHLHRRQDASLCKGQVRYRCQRPLPESLAHISSILRPFHSPPAGLGEHLRATGSSAGVHRHRNDRRALAEAGSGHCRQCCTAASVNLPRGVTLHHETGCAMDQSRGKNRVDDQGP